MTKVNILKERLKSIEQFIDNFENKQLSKIDIDILLEKTRNLYEEIIDIHINNNNSTETLELKSEEKYTSENHEDNSGATNSNYDDELVDLLEEEEVEVIEVEEKEEEQTPKITENQTNVETTTNNNSISNKEKQVFVSPEINFSSQSPQQTSLFDNGTNNRQNITISDKLGVNKTSLNERFAEKNNQTDISNNLKPISDIRVGIGVGDRFLFVRELFNGNIKEFDSAIDYLNTLNSYNDAQRHLETNFHWDRSSATVDSFMNIVKRRFPSTK